MKRILTSLLLALFIFSAFAQEPHLKFKGIPIDGDFKVFAQKLVQKGFKQIESTPDGIALSGNFMATPDVMVVVYPDPKSKKVSNVMALMEANDNWASIETRYNDIVDTYTEKYGEPTEHIEEFTDEVYNSDSWRLSRLRDGQCNYMSLWETEGGRIVITIRYFKFKYYVICSYYDEQNVKALHQTILDDI